MWVMRICLSRQDYKQMILWAKEAHPKECCGLLWSYKISEQTAEDLQICDVEMTDNVAANPEKFFEIAPLSLIKAIKRSRNADRKIVGYFHSHPNNLCQPSIRDAEQANPDNMIWLIIADKVLTAWQYNENGALHGKFNEVSIIIYN